MSVKKDTASLSLAGGDRDEQIGNMTDRTAWFGKRQVKRNLFRGYEEGPKTTQKNTSDPSLDHYQPSEVMTHGTICQRSTFNPLPARAPDPEIVGASQSNRKCGIL